MRKPAFRMRQASAGIPVGTGRYRWRVSAREVDMTMRPPAPRTLRVATTRQTVTVDLRRTVIVVVDMQNDFCSAGGWADLMGADYSACRRAIAPLQRLLPPLRGAGVPVIWLNWGNRPDRINTPPPVLHVFKRNGTGIGIGDPLPKSGAPALTKDSWAAAVVDELVREPRDISVDKYRLSGFWDTPLDSILRNLGTRSILFAGVNIDQCVLHSLADASFLGYGCLLIKDCCATISPDFCTKATIWNVERCFGFVTQSRTILTALRGARPKSRRS
jgi:nicotinamidase-related amidase